MEPSTDTPVEVANPRAVGRRRVLSGVALVLACLTILIATVAVWVHQVAFNTDRFTALVANVIDEPAVIAPLSTAVSAQVVEALDVQTRIAGRLPDAAKSLAPAITLAIEDGDRQPAPGRTGQAAGPVAPAQDRVDRAYPGHEPASRQPGRGRAW